MKEKLPIYNDEGRVDDAEVARKMAKHEDWARKGTSIMGDDKEWIDHEVEKVGMKEFENKRELTLGEKIKSILSGKEVEWLKLSFQRREYGRSTDYKDRFFDLIIFRGPQEEDTKIAERFKFFSANEKEQLIIEKIKSGITVEEMEFMRKMKRDNLILRTSSFFDPFK
jgi:hypothetical protein